MFRVAYYLTVDGYGVPTTSPEVGTKDEAEAIAATLICMASLQVGVRFEITQIRIQEATTVWQNV